MAIADPTQERLLQAATEVFARKGFTDATVREICQAAGVNLAAVNYHYGDKQRLYIETVKQAHFRRFQEVPLPQWSPGTPAAVRLHDFVCTLLRRMLNDPDSSCHGRLMLRELAQPSDACAELVQQGIRPQFELLLGILRELTAPELPLAQLHLIAFSVVGQCLYFRVAEPIVSRLLPADEYATYDAELLAAHITRWTLAALGLAAPVTVPLTSEQLDAQLTSTKR